MKIYWTHKLPQTKLNWHDAYFEVIEFVEEVKKGNLKKMLEEACDIYTAYMCAITTATGIGIPLFWTWSAKKWIGRLVVWKSIFNGYGLKFKVEYIRYGGNYERPWKVDKAIQLACKDQQQINN